MQIGRKSIRLKSGQFLNLDESEVAIRINSDWEFSLNHSNLGLIRIKSD